MLFQLPRRHTRVATYFRLVSKTFPLAFSCSNDVLANGSRAFLGAFAGNVAIFHGRHFNVQIDAIEQRPRDTLTVALHLNGAAAAFTLQIAKIAARAGIHCRRSEEHTSELQSRGLIS